MNGFNVNIPFFASVGRTCAKNFWHTAMADSAKDEEMITVANECVYR